MIKIVLVDIDGCLMEGTLPFSSTSFGKFLWKIAERLRLARWLMSIQRPCRWLIDALNEAGVLVRTGTARGYQHFDYSHRQLEKAGLRNFFLHCCPEGKDIIDFKASLAEGCACAIDNENPILDGMQKILRERCPRLFNVSQRTEIERFLGGMK